MNRYPAHEFLNRPDATRRRALPPGFFIALLTTLSLLCISSRPALAQSSVSSRVAANAEIGTAVQAVGKDSFAGINLEFADGVVAYPDLTYAVVTGFRPLKLDLFLPPASYADAGPRPLIVYVHGGAWAWGGPRRSAAYKDWPAVLADLARNGYVVASVGYRFSREAPFPAAIQDVKSAIQWLRANAAQYHIDTGRIAIWGQSSGGHLAMLAATSCGVAALEPDPGAVAAPVSRDVESIVAEGTGQQLKSSCVHAVAGWFGIYDFGDRLDAQDPDSTEFSPRHEFFGCTSSPCSGSLLRAASPISHVDSGDPPVLLIHGEADAVLPVAQSQLLRDALLDADVNVAMTIIPGAGHSWISETPEATRAASRQALRETVDFFEATIGDGRGDK